MGLIITKNNNGKEVKKLDYLNDDIQKLFFDIHSTYLGYSFVHYFLTEATKLDIGTLYPAPSEQVREISESKTTINDTLYIDSHGTYIDIETQKKITDKDLNSSLIILYQSTLVRTSSRKGKKYRKIPNSIQLRIYDGIFSDGDELVVELKYKDKEGKSHILDKTRCFMVELGKLEKLLKDKGIENFDKFERLTFFMKFRLDERYTKEIEYILEKDEEACAMDRQYEDFTKNPGAYLTALNRELSEDYLIEDALITGETNGRINEKRSMLIRLLSLKFGNLSQSMIDRINNSSSEQLDLIINVLFDIQSVDDINNFM